MPPLSDLLVLDLTRVLAGPFATLVLSDLGAEVVKIEMPPKGDESRGFPPFQGGVSGYFVSVNRGKKSVTLNLKHPEGKAAFIELAKRADIVCENFRPGVMRRLGLDYPRLAKINPRLIYAATSGFGQTGPWAERPAYDMIVQGMSGIMSITGEPGRPPVRVGASIADLSAAMFTVTGILAALHERERTGRGRMVDVAMLDSLIAFLENAVVRYGLSGEPPHALGARHPSITPFELFESSDGYVVLAIGNDAIWRRFVDAVGDARLRAPEFETNAGRTENYERLAPLLKEVMSGRSTDEWIERLAAAGVPCGPYHDVGRMVEHAQIQARGVIQRLVQPDGGEFLVAGDPIKLGDEPSAPLAPAPRLGEHTDEVLGSLLGYSAGRIQRLRDQAAI